MYNKMLLPKKDIVKYVKEEYGKGSHDYTVQELAEILFECNKDDMDFFIEELISSAGEGDSSYNISYYDDNADCICLVGDVDYKYYDMSAQDIANLFYGWQARVDKFKQKFLVFKKD